MQWDKVIAGGVTDISATANTARLVCPYCEHEIKDSSEKNKMVSSPLAKWESTNPLADPTHEGYHLNSLCSSYISISDACKMFFREAKETNQLQDFRNRFQALPWRHDAGGATRCSKAKRVRGQI